MDYSSNFMAHLKDSGEEIEIMLTKNSDEEVQRNHSKLKPIECIDDLYVSIAFCLESMSANEGRVCNRETSTNVSSFYKLKASSDFIETLF